MEKGRVYTQEKAGSMQTVWSQFHKDTTSVVWSDDGGRTWNEVPGMDTGKWPLFSIKGGHLVDWIFKVKDSYCDCYERQGFSCRVCGSKKR